MPGPPAFAGARRLAGAIVLVAIMTAALAGQPPDASAAPLVVRPWKPWGSLIPPVDSRSPTPATGRRPSSTHLDRPSDGPPERAAPPRERGDEEEESEKRDPPEPEPEAPDVDVGATTPGGPAGPQAADTGGGEAAAATTESPTADAGGDGAPMALALIAAVAVIATGSVMAIRAERR